MSGLLLVSGSLFVSGSPFVSGSRFASALLQQLAEVPVRPGRLALDPSVARLLKLLLDPLPAFCGMACRGHAAIHRPASRAAHCEAELLEVALLDAKSPGNVLISSTKGPRNFNWILR
jgi:hypothetical protein